MKTARWLFLLNCFCSSLVFSDEPEKEIDVRTWAVTARAVESPLLKRRLLPAEHQLRNGNAAPILLRLPWDQMPYMNQIPPKFPEMLQIPIVDVGRIRDAGEAILFDRFYSEMRRAAYRRTADWEYPIGEQPVGDIVLPDVQGARDFMRGLAVWIRLQIANDNVDEAREGILVGLANARHYGRTPFLITNLVAAAHVRLMQDRLEELLQHPECPNLYWALTALPSPFLDVRPAYEFEREFLQRSSAGLSDLDELRSADEWREIADRMLEYFRENELAGEKREPSAEQRASTERLMLALARSELPKLQPDLAKRVTAMSDGELTVRWIVARRIELSDRATAAIGLDFPQAMERLRANDEEIEQFLAQWKLYGFFLQERSAYIFASLRSIDRRIAALRAVEAVRNHAATHEGKVPRSLRDIVVTPVPYDPFTGAPFGYVPDDDTRGFRITAPVLETPLPRGYGGSPKQGINWQIRVKKP